MTGVGTWVLVADGGGARILATDRDDHRLKALPGMTFTNELDKTSDIVHDRLPRTFESVGRARHAIAPRSDPHDMEKQKFAGKLAETLATELARHSYEKLIVIAPARMLGSLRSEFPDAVRKAVVAEHALDLVKCSDSDIAERLK